MIQTREPYGNVFEHMCNYFTNEESLELFRKICVNRHFELNLIKAYNTGVIKMPIYLSLGEEHIPAAISMVYKDCLIFRQHRGHSYYLSFGGDINALIDEMLHRPTGCTGGRGGSSHLSCKDINYFGHCGLIGNEVSIAVGASFASNKNSLCVIGDAAIEEDYVLSVFGFASKHKTPVLFIGEDNDLSILTRTNVRRDWDECEVVKSFGIEGVARISDDPWAIMYWVSTLSKSLPAFINIETCREYWHAGTGNDGPAEWNRFELIKQTMIKRGLANDIETIENDVKKDMEKRWETQLQIQ